MHSWGLWHCRFIRRDRGSGAGSAAERPGPSEDVANGAAAFLGGRFGIRSSWAAGNPQPANKAGQDRPGKSGARRDA